MESAMQQSRLTELERMLIDKIKEAENRLNNLNKLMSDGAEQELRLLMRLTALSDLQMELLERVVSLEDQLQKLSTLLGR